MTSFNELIKSAFSAMAISFIDDVSREHQIDKDALITKWNTLYSDCVLKPQNKVFEPQMEVVQAIVVSEINNENDKNEEVKKHVPRVSSACLYVFTRGKDKKGQVCNARVSEKSTTQKFCSRHLKEENKGKQREHISGDKPKKKVPWRRNAITHKRTDENCDECKDIVSDEEKYEDDKECPVVCKMNKYKQNIYPQTTMIVEREDDDIIVVGKEGVNGEILRLDKEQLEFCKKKELTVRELNDDEEYDALTEEDVLSDEE